MSNKIGSEFQEPGSFVSGRACTLAIGKSKIRAYKFSSNRVQAWERSRRLVAGLREVLDTE